MTTRCLFCEKFATTICCSNCREIDRSVMFETVLALLSKASVAEDYYDQIKIICQQIETVRSIKRCFKLI